MKTVLLSSGYSLAFTSHYLWLVALLFLVAVTLTWLYYRRTNPPLSKGRRIVLGILRGVAVASLFFVFAEPLLTTERTDLKTATVAILTDNSTSMANNQHSKPQFEVIESIVATVKSRVGGSAEVREYTFSDTITFEGISSGEAEVTAIGDVLRYLGKESEGENLQAVVLLSDGVSNYGVNPATQARKLGVPVHTVGFGNSEKLPDIRIVNVLHNRVGFAGKEMPIEITIESEGFKGQRLPLRLRHKGKTLMEKSLNVLAEGKQQTVTLSFLPPSEGVYTLQISLPAQDSEQSVKNNARQIQIKVRKSKIKVLLATAYLNWEYRFLKRTLSSRDDFEVTGCIQSERRIQGTIPFPENLDALSEYDVLLLLDFSPRWLDKRQQLLNAFFDRTGKGLFFLAGERFGAARKNDFSAQFLPLRFEAARGGTISRETALQLTEQGRIHPIMKLIDDLAENERRYGALPPFAGYLGVGAVNEGATVLAQTVIPDESGGGTPILASHRYRNGKIVCLSAHPFWKLDFLTRGFQAGDSTYAKLVENITLWLIARDDLRRMAITPEKPIFVTGESVNLSAHVLDDSYQPIVDAEIEATLVAENGTDTITVSFQPQRAGEYAATLYHLAAGQYQVTGRIARESVIIGKPKTSFVVEPYSLEDLSSISDFDMLKRISRASGGSFYTVADTANIPTFPDLPVKTVVHRSETTLFDHPLFLLLFVITVCTEWILRRSYQLL